LRFIAEKTARSLRADRCALFLLDEEQGDLVLRAVDNPDRPAEALGLRLSLEARPHVAEAIATRRPVEIPDVFADPTKQDFWPLARELGLRAFLAVPIMVKERVIGAISLDRVGDQPPFSADEVSLCQTIANQAAVAIENARLYEKVTERMREATALYKVSNQLMRTLNPDQILEKVLDILQSFFGYLNCAILLVDEEARELEVRAARGYPQEIVGKVRFKIGQEGIVGWVAAHKTALNVPDVTQDSRYVKGVEETRSEMAVPMIAGDKVIGVLDVQRSEVNAFNNDDLRVLSSVAAQAAIAIERSRLYFAERRLHATIAEERAKLEAIIGGTHDAIIVTDAQNRVLLMNQAAQRVFDVETVPEVGRPLEEVVSNESLLALFAQPEAREKALTEEIPLSDGRTLYASLTPVAEVGRVAVMQDITYLKELDNMKSDFVASVSHDLRSPLTLIIGYALMLPEAGELNETQQEFVESIKLSVAKMTTLIENLLDLGKIEASVGMEMEPCQLVTVINKEVAGLRDQAGAKEIILQLQLPPELPLVQGNQVRLDQVVSNLVGNAVKFTPEGGMVTVSARGEKGEVVVEVKDTGIGIAPEDQVHLFEKFYRVGRVETSDIEGTGLGLAIVKSIVEGHGGRVWVESEFGQGSTFGFALPIAS
jgi:signal transduction histidine kinase